MGIKERTITVAVSKKIQEQDYEPFSLHLGDSITFDKNVTNPQKVRSRLYSELTKELDKLIDKRWESLVPEDDE